MAETAADVLIVTLHHWGVEVVFGLREQGRDKQNQQVVRTFELARDAQTRPIVTHFIVRHSLQGSKRASC